MEVRKPFVSDLASVIGSDPFLNLLEGLKRDRVETIRRLDAQDKQIDKIREQTLSIAAVARSANFWGGEDHDTVVSFLKNIGVVVPRGNPNGKSGNDTWYAMVGREFKAIIKSKGYVIEEPRCRKMSAPESRFDPWYYPTAWLEEAFPTWVKAIEIGAYPGGKNGRKKWFQDQGCLTAGGQGRLRLNGT